MTTLTDWPTLHVQHVPSGRAVVASLRHVSGWRCHGRRAAGDEGGRGGDWGPGRVGDGSRSYGSRRGKGRLRRNYGWLS